MKRYLLLISGMIMLIFTYIGILLPGVPAIPFIVIALVCFAGFSDAWLQWFRQLPFIGTILRRLEKYRTKPWFTWLLASQLLVSAIVAERIIRGSGLFSVLWYTSAIILTLIFGLLLQRSGAIQNNVNKEKNQ